MLFSRLHGTATTSSGSWSINTPKYSIGFLLQVIIEPTTSTNIYDFSITDEYGFTVLPTHEFDTVAIEGVLNLNKLEIPLLGIYTLSITSATVDEVIKYELIVQEV